MVATKVFETVGGFASRLRKLKTNRHAKVARTSGVRRHSLSKLQREQVLRKTRGRCHICGGRIRGDDWQADHVLAHSTGGVHAADNFLPAHTICNNYRWNYGAEEFQWILKLGVWLRNQIHQKTRIGMEAGQRFCDYEKRRDKRRKNQQQARSV